MCYNNCPKWSGETCRLKPKESCVEDADYCETCDTFFDEDNPCECEEE